MLDPRIYRTGFVAVALAVIVFAFSLQDQQDPLAPALAPDAFNGQNVEALMNVWAGAYPNRRPGSDADDALAGEIARRLRRIQGGYAVSTSVFKARTADGLRPLETVTAVRAGELPGSIVVVAHRDSLGAPATADLSGSAVLIELARVLAGQTQQRTIVLASTSGSAGAAGALQLAQTLPGPVDAVIALGDLAGTRVHQPVVVPWSDARTLAPPLLRSTAASVIAAQAALRVEMPSLGSQFAHLAFPFTLSEQGPFDARLTPAVAVSAAGDAAPAVDEPTSPDQVRGLGRSLLATMNALDTGPTIPRASAYLVLAGKIIPTWAIRLLVLALMLPVLAAAIDGAARTHRRGYPMAKSVVWVLAAGVPFALAALAAVGLRVLGVLDAVPPEPVGRGAVPMHGAGAAALGMIAAVIVIGFFVARPVVIHLAGARRVLGKRPGEWQGAGAATLLVLCATAIAIWATNPFAAALTLPALHLWMWILDAKIRLRRATALALVLAGLAAPALVIIFYAHALALGPVELLWNVLLLIAGGHVAPAVALEYSVLLGCVASLLAIVRRPRQEPAPEPTRVSVRGPVTYAGPGSLGGTESALRMRR
jgi:hypothetical protein